MEKTSVIRGQVLLYICVEEEISIDIENLLEL